MKKFRYFVLLLALLCLCAACSAPKQAETDTENDTPSAPSEPDAPSLPEEPEKPITPEAPVEPELPEEPGGDEVIPEDGDSEVLPEDPVTNPEDAAPDPYLICIDAGHQEHGSSEKEPNGPGSSEMKARVTGGTQGTTTGLYEYELNLQVSLKLQAELESRGYAVVMVRTENDVDLSNVERSQVANEAGADAFIRVHANGSESSSAQGTMTICMTPSNPYNGDLYDQSRRLSDCILEGLTAATGAESDGVWETDTMTGINWCQTPVTIVEMGYMTNPEEDQKMASEEYQLLLAQGIADGVDAYFAENEASETDE